jgi:hypothetical protein
MMAAKPVPKYVNCRNPCATAVATKAHGESKLRWW